MCLSPATLGVSSAVSQGSGYPQLLLPGMIAQLAKFKLTCSTLISTISEHHRGRIHSIKCAVSLCFADQRVTPPLSLKTPRPFYPARHRRRHLISPRHWAFAQPSPGIQWDYTVIIRVSILYDSIFHVRDLQSCFINSAWMKPDFKHTGA